PLLFV
ncbi:hypothetical protein BN1708_017857, partial [Verticillium longisporum]